jgi:hypothetical protein
VAFKDPKGITQAGIEAGYAKDEPGPAATDGRGVVRPGAAQTSAASPTPTD